MEHQQEPEGAVVRRKGSVVDTVGWDSMQECASAGVACSLVVIETD